jgi:hypothetical protein
MEKEATTQVTQRQGQSSAEAGAGASKPVAALESIVKKKRAKGLWNRTIKQLKNKEESA